MKHHSEYTALHFFFDVAILSIVLLTVILLRLVFSLIFAYAHPEPLLAGIYDTTISAISATLAGFVIAYFTLCFLLRIKRRFFNRYRAIQAQAEAAEEAEEEIIVRNESANESPNDSPAAQRPNDFLVRSTSTNSCSNPIERKVLKVYYRLVAIWWLISKKSYYVFSVTNREDSGLETYNVKLEQMIDIILCCHKMPTYIEIAEQIEAIINRNCYYPIIQNDLQTYADKLRTYSPTWKDIEKNVKVMDNMKSMNTNENNNDNNKEQEYETEE